MTEFMECGPVPIDWLEIGSRWRHLYEIVRRVVVGACTPDAEIRASGGDQRLGSGLNLIWRRRYDRGSDPLGQAIALVRVEDGKTLEKWDGTRLFTGLRGAPTFVVRGKAIGIDDSRSPFALPDMAANPERLAKSEPALSEKTVLDDGTSQDQYINPGISALRRRVARHRERRLDRRRPPWLHPRDTASFQLGDDLVGDFGEKARTVVAGTNSGGMSRHRGSPRRAPEASPPIFNPSREPRPALSLLATVTRHILRGKRTAHPHACLCARDGSPEGEDPRSGASAQPTARSRREAPTSYPIRGAEQLPRCGKRMFAKSPDRVFHARPRDGTCRYLWHITRARSSFSASRTNDS